MQILAALNASMGVHVRESKSNIWRMHWILYMLMFPVLTMLLA